MPTVDEFSLTFPKAVEIACGLKYLHENDVVHGDLKVVCVYIVTLSLRT
jgi:serine/threonine protein kinase